MMLYKILIMHHLAITNHYCILASLSFAVNLLVYVKHTLGIGTAINTAEFSWNSKAEWIKEAASISLFTEYGAVNVLSDVKNEGNLAVPICPWTAPAVVPPWLCFPCVFSRNKTYKRKAMKVKKKECHW